jgi:1-aminocyclopropane-1-carboxylate deaminase/D-cysteine desulfhydrase-like pyridoxal-dependent ACC family enzyme
MKKYTIILLLCSAFSYAHERNLLDTFLEHVSVSPSIATKLYELVTDREYPCLPVDKKMSLLPLVQAYPSLYGKIPYISLGILPTAVQKMAACGKELGLSHVYIKRDDQTGENQNFGGNKMRKLPFLFGDALTHQVPAVITVGAAGSNHVLATIDCAHKLGLLSHAFLIPQVKGAAICRNLLWGYARDGQLMLCPNKELRNTMVLAALLWYKQTYGAFPYFIPTGGSCPLGAVGYVNAAFELREQIKQGELPEPDYIYITLGSGGTVAGLVLGCKAAGLRSRIMAVTVEPSTQQEWYDKVIRLAQKTNELISAADSTFPQYDITEADFDIVTRFGGERYGKVTEKGAEAAKLVEDTEHIILDSTYTAKTFSALIDAVKERQIKQDASILFWHTYCGDQLPQDVQKIDYHELPVAFHEYCE